VDRIADHATFPDGTLRVQVYWTGYPEPTWMDAVDAPHETLRVYLRRTARPGLPHTSADPPPTPSRAPGPAVGAAAGVAAPSAATRPRLTRWIGAAAGCGRGGGVGCFAGALGGCRAPGSPGPAVTGLRRHAAAPRRPAHTLGT